MNTKLSGAFALIFFFFFFSACQSYKKVPYLQDAEILKQANTQVAPVQDARLIPGDEAETSAIGRVKSFRLLIAVDTTHTMP